MTQLDRRAAELARFFPPRAVAAILGVDRDEIADLRGRAADPIDPATGFRDPRFTVTTYSGETTLTHDDATGVGEGFVDYYSLNMDHFLDQIGEAEEYLLEASVYGEWKTTDEGTEPDPPIGVMLHLGYDGEPLPGAEVDSGGEFYPLEGDILLSSTVPFPTSEPDDFYAFDLEGSERYWQATAVRPAPPRAYPQTRLWVVDRIATVSVQVFLVDEDGVAAATRAEGEAVLRNIQISARLATQDTLAGG